MVIAIIAVTIIIALAAGALAMILYYENRPDQMLGSPSKKDGDES